MKRKRKKRRVPLKYGSINEDQIETNKQPIGNQKHSVTGNERKKTEQGQSFAIKPIESVQHEPSITLPIKNHIRATENIERDLSVETLSFTTVRILSQEVTVYRCRGKIGSLE